MGDIYANHAETMKLVVAGSYDTPRSRVINYLAHTVSAIDFQLSTFTRRAARTMTFEV